MGLMQVQSRATVFDMFCSRRGFPGGGCCHGSQSSLQTRTYAARLVMYAGLATQPLPNQGNCVHPIVPACVCDAYSWAVPLYNCIQLPSRRPSQTAADNNSLKVLSLHSRTSRASSLVVGHSSTEHLASFTRTSHSFVHHLHAVNKAPTVNIFWTIRSPQR
jgi:hypothetical protein